MLEQISKAIVESEGEQVEMIETGRESCEKEEIETVDEKVEEYILNLVFATRNPKDFHLDDLENFIEYGASPRASINLVLASKARAFLEHRGYITPEDVRYIGADILRHRIILTYEAEAEEITSDDIVQRLFDTIEVP